MRIAVICDVLGDKNNGTTIVAFNLIDFLRQKGHEVRIVCPDEEHTGEEGYWVVPKMHFGIFQSYVDRNGVAPAKLDKRILYDAIHDVDLIHVMIPFALGKAAAKYANQHGIPLTAGFHCQAENITSHIFLKDSRFANRVTYKILNERLYKYCDGIHYPTEFIRDTFERIVGTTPHFVISNGVGDEFRPMKAERPEALRDKYILLFTGRLSREKSHNVLIDAVAKSKHRDKIQLFFAGEGPLERELLAHAKRVGISAPVIKFYSRAKLLNTINMADLYVHPAEIEIEAISCLEAIACGKVPLIADSPRSATRFFALSEKNLFKSGDAVDLSHKLDFWLDHPDERKKCSEEYLGYAERFRLKDCMEAMEDMLKKVANEKKKDCLVR